MNRALYFFFPVLLGSFIGGTGCSVPSYEIQVWFSPELKESYGCYPSLEVDIAGVRPAEAERLADYDVERYFQPGNTMRSNLKPETLCFSEDTARFQSVGKENPAWREWNTRGCSELFLIVNLPQRPEGGTRDLRKQIIALETSLFSHDKRYIEIGPGGIVLLREPPPEDSSNTPKKEF